MDTYAPTDEYVASNTYLPHGTSIRTTKSICAVLATPPIQNKKKCTSGAGAELTRDLMRDLIASYDAGWII